MKALKRRGMLLLVLLILPLIFAGCGGGKGSTGNILGKVVDYLTGEPVPNARVVIDNHITETGEDGRFAVAGVKAGEKEINVTAQGYWEYFEKIKVTSSKNITIRMRSEQHFDKVTTAKMLERMTDLEWLANPPEPGEFSGQFSSYDRKSLQAAITKQGDWFANGDAGNYIKTRVVDGKLEYVMAEMYGPGAIVRIWSANPTGTLLIYIDDENKPAIEVDFSKAANGNGPEPFVPPFAKNCSRGTNIYFPFIFGRKVIVSCRNPKENMYYHVNYVKFPAGTGVEPYSHSKAGEYLDNAGEVIAGLNDPYAAYKEKPGTQSIEFERTIQPGESYSQFITGPGAITKIELKVEASDLDKVLRDTLLKIEWDISGEPGVWTPLGDFFGASPGLNPYKTLPLGILGDGTLYCHWFMPFNIGANIYFVNEGTQPVTLRGVTHVLPVAWEKDLLYFHAGWKSWYPILSSPRKDLEMLNADGPGRYVGLMISVMNPVTNWWGEGDEKVYVDHEPFPSTFGTGTEDYFGYAWASPQLFSSAYHSQPRADGPGNRGRIINNRFHVNDNIPFQDHIKFDMELWHWVSDLTMDYSAVAYWYSVFDKIEYTYVPPEKRQIVWPP